MSRCYICDYSPTTPESDYKKSFASKRHRNKLILDKKTGDTICLECSLVSMVALGSSLKEDEEVYE